MEDNIFFTYRTGVFNITIEAENLSINKTRKLFKFCHWWSAVKTTSLASNICQTLNDLTLLEKNQIFNNDDVLEITKIRSANRDAPHFTTN